jgi:hypothetical protein
MPEPSPLDARLAEIDRRLRTIQSGLAPAPQSAAPPSSFTGPTLVPPPGPPEPPEPPGPSGRPPGPPSPERHFPPATDASELLAQLRELVAAQERWLASARELLAAHDMLPAAVPPPPPAAGQPRPPAAASSALPAAAPSAPRVPGPVSVSAGPFASTEALKRFERALLLLPEVRQVVVREYASDDRAVVDVHLFEPIS